jgi:hypothetical protein
MGHRSGFLTQRACVVAVISLLAVTQADAERRPIDAAHSTLTVFAYKSGLFSAFAGDHVISAPIASGTISEDAPRGIELVVRSAGLRVLDPDLAPERRAEVQARMLGSEVLDTMRFPEIAFVSTTIEPAGADRWNVTGRLTIHGQTRVMTLSVALLNGKYRGQALIKQRDFGIEPIKVAGGTVKVKDELKIQFEIARASQGR